MFKQDQIVKKNPLELSFPKYFKIAWFWFQLEILPSRNDEIPDFSYNWQSNQSLLINRFGQVWAQCCQLNLTAWKLNSCVHKINIFVVL